MLASLFALFMKLLIDFFETTRLRLSSDMISPMGCLEMTFSSTSDSINSSFLF